MTPAQIHRARSGYYGEISFIDTQIGRLMGAMQDHDPETLDNTWILFTSDHGDMQGDHNLWRKTYAYEGSSRIPFFLAPLQGNERCQRPVADDVVELRDVMPTLLELAGVAIPASVDGRSVLPLMRNAEAGWRPYIHGEHCACYAEEQEMQFVTNGRRKFIWLPRVHREQFFDLERDPGECRDLTHDPSRQDEIQQWRRYLVQELDSRQCGWVKNGELHCPDHAPLMSPFKHARWTGRNVEYSGPPVG